MPYFMVTVETDSYYNETGRMRYHVPVEACDQETARNNIEKAVYRTQLHHRRHIIISVKQIAKSEFIFLKK